MTRTIIAAVLVALVAPARAQNVSFSTDFTIDQLQRHKVGGRLEYNSRHIA
jgi:hypothetical protein